MLYLSEVEQLKKGKNLLAFSAGVDSSALFFILLENSISFDIALINYGLREQSIQEEEYALFLAKKYHIKCHTKKAPLFQNNFEKNARDFRYSFFDELMQKHNYHNLITAHQLNDQLEWFLMRLTKGAGASELLGLDSLSIRKNYHVIRPILHHSKEELLNYLEEHQHRYFIDKSNYEDKYERNYFRSEFSNQLIAKYKKGIQKSFSYLKEDKEILISGYREIFHQKKFYILEIENPKILIRIVDLYLKKLGYLLSSNQREEIAKETSMVIGGLWAIERVEKIIYLSPYLKTTIPKKSKETFRLAKIPPKVRSYLYQEGIEV